MTPTELRDKHKGLLLKDLRIQLRARGLNPAGGREALLDRLIDAMIATNDCKLYGEGEGQAAHAPAAAAPADQNAPPPPGGNNYSRPGGQNVGNFLTERNSSRVLAAPGGGSQIVFGDDPAPSAAKAAPVAKTVNVDAIGVAAAPPPPCTEPKASGADADGPPSNNYHRPSGQNVGNFLTARNSSRVSAPPGGASQITFG